MSRADEVRRWLEALPDVVDISVEEQAHLETLIGHPGFAVFLGLVHASKRTYMEQLCRMPLSTAESAGRASVIQGIVAGLEASRQIALSIVTDAEESTADQGLEQEQVND